MTSTQGPQSATDRRRLERRTRPESKSLLFDIAGLASHLGVTERFVRRLVEERRVPFHKIGKFVRFHPDDIDVWINKQRVEQLNDN